MTVSLAALSFLHTLPWGFLPGVPHRLPYHSASIVEVMLVLVGVGTEVHAGRDPREGSPFLEPQAAIDRYFLIGYLWGQPESAPWVGGRALRGPCVSHRDCEEPLAEKPCRSASFREVLSFLCLSRR